VLYVHVIAGGIAILAGCAAMLFAKGTPRHRRAGDVYVVAMLVMTSSAFVAAAFLRPNKTNVLAAMFTFYLVASAWLAMHRRRAQPGLLDHLASVVGAAAAWYGFTVVSRIESPGMEGFGYAFGGIATLCVASDVRWFLGRELTRTQRLVRHVWRMGFTFFVATGSFFLGQMKHLPDWVTAPRLNVLIALVPVVLLVFWLIRVRFPPWSRKSRPAVIIAATEA
jgi:hypothetical protein